MPDPIRKLDASCTFEVFRSKRSTFLAACKQVVLLIQHEVVAAVPLALAEGPAKFAQQVIVVGASFIGPKRSITKNIQPVIFQRYGAETPDRGKLHFTLKKS